jgi:hypothetical protein
MEYPELKRAMREQCQAFEASVGTLIEDKASGTTPRWCASGRTTNPWLLWKIVSSAIRSCPMIITTYLDESGTRLRWLQK